MEVQIDQRQWHHLSEILSVIDQLYSYIGIIYTVSGCLLSVMPLI